jgi:hypothetical protein
MGSVDSCAVAGTLPAATDSIRAAVQPNKKRLARFMRTLLWQVFFFLLMAGVLRRFCRPSTEICGISWFFDGMWFEQMGAYLKTPQI